MITIRVGELFVEKYNEENGTKLSPKEIFRMLADKAFRGGRHMVNWTNSTFFNYLKEYNKFLDGKREEPSFEEAVEKFCNYVEDRSCGIETSLNVYGGCALPKGADGKMNVTEFNYCDNLHFTVDERYCSFIGSFFQILVGNFATVINNKDIVWLMYQSFNEYYDFIHNNDEIADKQLPTWNGCYFCQTIFNRGEFIKDKKLKNNRINTINFLEYLDAVSKLNGVNVSNMVFENFGQTNITCGCITLDLENVKGWFNIFNKIVANNDEEFDIDAYCKLFNKDNLLRVSMEYGEVTSNMIEPLFDLKTRMKNNEFSGKERIKFLNEYLKVIMSEKENNMAKEFGQFLTKSTKSKKSISFKAELENIFSAKKVTDLGNAIVAVCNKANIPYNEGTPYEVVSHFTNDKNKEKLMEFLMYTKFNM